MAVGRKEYRGQQRQRQVGRVRRRNDVQQGRGGGGGVGKARPVDARQRLRKNIIVKPQPGASNRVQVYTTHFDARNKINAKKGITSSQNQSRPFQSRSQGVARKTVNDGRKGPTPNTTKKNGTVNKFQPSHSQSSIIKNAKRINNPTGNRETIFTGKSIKVHTTNDLVPKERKALVKGKSLSVIAKNKTSKPNKPLHKTIDNGNWIGPSRLPSPEPVPLTPASSSSTKKSIPAKLVISNLHPNVTQEDILELFGAIGPLRDGRLKSVGTADVIYRVAEDAFTAYSKYHGRNLDGQPMILKITTAEEAGSSRQEHQAPSHSRSSKYGAISSAPPAPSFYSAPPLGSNSATSSVPVVFTVKL